MLATSQRVRVSAFALALVVQAVGFMRVSALAQTTATITGAVRDSTGAALPGATVSVGTVGGAERTTTTDAEGRYALAGLPSGAYQARASLAGFRTDVRNVDVNTSSVVADFT